MRKTILMLLLAAISSGAMAEWVWVWISTDGEKWYIDPQTIKKDGNLRRGWVLINEPAADKDFGSLSNRALVAFDCKGERSSVLQISYHSEPMARGRLIDSFTFKDDDWHYNAPGTAGEAILKIVCSK